VPDYGLGLLRRERHVAAQLQERRLPQEVVIEQEAAVEPLHLDSAGAGGALVLATGTAIVLIASTSALVVPGGSSIVVAAGSSRWIDQSGTPWCDV
jgi:hypothetical protein